MDRKTDLYSLDVNSPEEVARVLFQVADKYRESASELTSAWQDRGAGDPWAKLAVILERAATQAAKVTP